MWSVSQFYLPDFIDEDAHSQTLHFVSIRALSCVLQTRKISVMIIVIHIIAVFFGQAFWGEYDQNGLHLCLGPDTLILGLGEMNQA